jgi:ABC-2 type transport system ATP-binding protein
MSPSALVETERLTKRYDAATALDDCNVAVRQGEIFGLLGPNGAGKTTLLRLLLGYLRPTSGRATIDGLDCERQSVEVRRRVAYLPGDVRLFPALKAREVLDFCGGFRDRDYAARARRLAERLDLDLNRRTTAMSTGMRQKLGLVAALAVAAPTIILDEPTANLDPTARNEVLELVREARSCGRTILFSSHILDEVERLCDRVVILRRGRLVHEQELRTLRQRHRIRAQFAGSVPELPQEFAEHGELQVRGGQLTIITGEELAPWLGRLASLPLVDVQIEPVGLAAVYEQFHPAVELSAAGRALPTERVS